MSKKNIFFFTFLLLLSFPFLSCYTPGDSKGKGALTLHNKFQGQVKVYQKALDDFKSGDYKKVKVALEELEPKVRVQSLRLLVLYNLGRTYEVLNQCEKAQLKYRELIQSALGEFELLKAKGVLRLGYVYECLNQDAKVIGSFLDAKRVKGILPRFTDQVEIPIRLALAYSRLNHWEVAKSFFDSSEKAFKNYSFFSSTSRKNQETLNKREEWAKTLYFISSLDKNFYNIKDPEIRLKALRYLQKYLIKIFQTKSLNWSKKALKSIKEAYEKLWIEIQKSKSIHKKLKKKLSLLIVKNLHELKTDQSLKIRKTDFKFLFNDPNWFQKIFLDKKKLEWNQMKKNLLSFTMNQELKWTLFSNVH